MLVSQPWAPVSLLQEVPPYGGESWSRWPRVRIEYWGTLPWSVGRPLPLPAVAAHVTSMSGAPLAPGRFSAHGSAVASSIPTFGLFLAQSMAWSMDESAAYRTVRWVRNLLMDLVPAWANA